MTYSFVVDGFIKCEKWEHVDSVDSKETKTTSWLKRFVGRAKKPEMTWPFPFAEGKLFVLTIQAGVEGYHIYVGGRHVSSFPYRMVCSLHLSFFLFKVDNPHLCNFDKQFEGTDHSNCFVYWSWLGPDAICIRLLRLEACLYSLIFVDVLCRDLPLKMQQV